MTVLEKNKCGENKFFSTLQNLIYSNLFPLFVSISSIIFYFTNGGLVGLYIFSVIAAFIFICQKDMSPIIPLFFNVPFIFSNLQIFENPLNYLAFLPALIGLIVHLFRYPSKVKIGMYGISLLLVLLTFLLSGVLFENYSSYFQPSQPWFGLAMSLVFGVGLGSFVAYFILKGGLHPSNKKGFDLSVYLAHTLIYLAFAVLLQVSFIRVSGNMTAWFGWGHRNFTGILILLAVPMCAYLIIKTERIFTYIFAILLLMIGCVISEGDAAIGLILIFSPILVFYVSKHLKKSKKMIFLNACYIITAIILSILLVKIIIDKEFLNLLLTRFLNDSGRTSIYKNALKTFKDNFIFGTGVFYPFIHVYWWTTNYHSSFVQALSTTGIVGLLALLFTYFARFRILMKKNTPFNVCAFLSVAFFIAHSSIDCGESTMLLLIVVGIITVCEHLNQFETASLPLLKLL